MRAALCLVLLTITTGTVLAQKYDGYYEPMSFESGWYLYGEVNENDYYKVDMGEWQLVHTSKGEYISREDPQVCLISFFLMHTKRDTFYFMISPECTQDKPFVPAELSENKIKFRTESGEVLEYAITKGHMVKTDQRLMEILYGEPVVCMVKTNKGILKWSVDPIPTKDALYLEGVY